jgi:putative GTP pyrophosphokinase
MADREAVVITIDGKATPAEEGPAKPTGVEAAGAPSAEATAAPADEPATLAKDAVATPFDFGEHERAAVSAYLNVYDFNKSLASVVGRVVEECLSKRTIKVHSVQHRAKDPKSFGSKSSIPSDSDPNVPKYPKPLEQITDLAAVRIITYFPETIDAINDLISHEFEVVERYNKGEELIEDERFGYQSVHYLIRLRHERTQLAEYENFAGSTVEIQVRTILQHAWAEIEHDIQYKSSTAIPVQIRRRFMALAGLLEIADREFQTIQNEDRRLTDEARAMVRRGELRGVEITPDALKSFLDKRLGPDDRIADWSYDWTARALKQLGFSNLKQVETAIERYNDDLLSNLVSGRRQGQTTRFELMLLAALGERFIERHPSKSDSSFANWRHRYLAMFRNRGIWTDTYDPLAAQPTPQVER